MPTFQECLGWIILAQDAGEGGDGAGEGNADPAGGGMGNSFFLLIGMLAILYIFMMVLPQRKEQKRAKEMLDALKKNDRVLFAGGIVGTVVNVHQDGQVSVRIDETTNAKMRVVRGAITRVLTDEDEEEAKTEGTKKSS